MLLAGRARRLDHAADDHWIGRCLRLRRPVQHLLLARNSERHAARRLRSLIAGRAQGARCRSERDRRHLALASARRPFRRATLPLAGRPIPHPTRAAVVDRRTAWYARTARSVARTALSETPHGRV